MLARRVNEKKKNKKEWRVLKKKRQIISNVQALEQRF